MFDLIRVFKEFVLKCFSSSLHVLFELFGFYLCMKTTLGIMSLEFFGTKKEIPGLVREWLEQDQDFIKMHILNNLDEDLI